MLECLGMDDIQETVYLMLLDRRSATAAQLARRNPEIDPVQVEGALAVLEARGLVAARRGSSTRYMVLPPGAALSGWLQAQTRQLRAAESALAELAYRYREAAPRRRDSTALVEQLHGPAALECWAQLARSATREKRALEQPPYEIPRTRLSPMEAEGLAQGVRHRVVYDQAAIEARVGLSPLREGLEAGEEARVIGRVPIRLLLVDDQVALLPSCQGKTYSEGLLVIRSPGLLSALSALFEAVWQQAVPLTLDRIDNPDRGRSQLDEQLVTTAGLLAAGLSDRAIASKLGVSVRTVERLVQRLSLTLGGKTRYQTGVLAARHGLGSADPG
jgi:DNA-binding CsgD family transcriptional regulator